MQITLIVGSVMGTALGVANALKHTLETNGTAVRLVEQFQPSDLTLDKEDIVLICTSNTGMGDLPANIVPFFDYLTQQLPQISGKRFGIITLGDSSYPNFAEAGNTLRNAMLDLGAILVGEPLVLDAIFVDDHEEEALQWLGSWTPQL